MRVKWCRMCGRLGAEAFIYCPYCGSEYASRPDLGELAEPGIEKAAAALPKDRFGWAERRLSEIERDLGDFIDLAGWDSS
jgi:hypothetical protein